MNKTKEMYLKEASLLIIVILQCNK